MAFLSIARNFLRGIQQRLTSHSTSALNRPSASDVRSKGPMRGAAKIPSPHFVSQFHHNRDRDRVSARSTNKNMSGRKMRLRICRRWRTTNVRIVNIRAAVDLSQPGGMTASDI
jgi:hypothetical protein